MKLPLAIGAAAVVTIAAAYAQPMMSRMMIHHGAEMEALDVDQDGWLTRAEASAAFERVFARLDANSDGRLDAADRPEGEARDVHIRRRHHHGAEGPGPHHTLPDDCTRTVEPENPGPGENQRVTIVCEREIREDGASDDPGGGRHFAHRIEIRDGNGMPAMPQHPPMFMMLIANSDEADLNGDGALSQDEFRAQHLRFFDASDANGDGRVRFERPPAPPEPPAPPAPPQPPR